MNVLTSMLAFFSGLFVAVADSGGDDTVSFDLWKVVAILVIIALIIWIFFTVRRRR